MFVVFGIGIVRFENSLCVSEGLWGTCYRRSQCTSIGGIGSGSCANGIGVCCICKYIFIIGIKKYKWEF